MSKYFIPLEYEYTHRKSTTALLWFHYSLGLIQIPILFYAKKRLYSERPNVNALATDSQNSVWDADGSSEKGSVASNI